MHKWVLVLLMMLICLIPAPVQAKAPLSFESVEIDLWPEYDQPTMLVIYRLTLDAATPLPADMAIRIPTTAGDPSAVATREVNGQLLTMAYTRTIQDDWSTISYKTTSLQMQFEYYDPALVKNGSTRTFTYEWQGDYAVKAMTLNIQQPVGASQMVLSPTQGSAISGDGGLAYYNAMIGSVPAGTKFKQSIQYQKNNDDLSKSAQSVQPSESLNAGTTGRAPNTVTVLAWALGALGVLLLAGGGFWYFRTGQVNKTEVYDRRHKPRKERVDESEVTTQDGVFCHQCGKRASTGDIFCRVCGTRLRKE
jgi:hypothetical protein